MTRTILSVAAVLAGALALAACGGSAQTNGVAGAHHTKTSGHFRAAVHGFEARLQTSVQAFESGNVAQAASDASLLTNCTSLVNGKLAPQARTSAQMKSVTHLRVACSDMSKATHAGMSGNLTKAKQFARAALRQAQIAARLSG
jgi:hypothetical protein